MELSHVRGQRGRYASWGEQRQRQTPSLRKGVSVAEAAKRPSIASIGGKSADASSTAGGVCCSAHYPSYATTNRCREPSASTITRCYVGSIRFRGVGTWFLSGLRAEGCACSRDEGYSTKRTAQRTSLSALDELCMENARQIATLAVVAVWKVPLGTEQCVAPRMPGTWCSGSLKADFLSQGA